MEKVTPNMPKPPILKKFTFDKTKINSLLVVIVIGIIVVGVGTGWILAKGGKVAGIATSNSKNSPSVKTNGNVVGITDEKTYKDSAEGKLEEGGISGEGMYHLVRPGGDSQNVYLTSTAVDLGSFVGKNVEVWGQTMTARKAGWLMDVGKVKIKE